MKTLTTYGDLTVLRTYVVDRNHHGIVQCACGTEFDIRLQSITRYGWTDCGCAGLRVGQEARGFALLGPVGTEDRASRKRWKARCLSCGVESQELAHRLADESLELRHFTCATISHADEVGNVYGRLTVREQVSEKGRGRVWLCDCECGGTTQAPTAELRRGNVRSCGCLQREAASNWLSMGIAWKNGTKPVVSYVGALRRVSKAKGKASEHSCVECGGSAHVWSYDGLDKQEYVSRDTFRNARYSLKPDHYRARCRSCHRSMAKTNS